ncbi:hypothetical protein [Chryseobacterium mucoviscidosis]|uniref:hypothetical protein n=1 Tax=Chryseobacterium mucoviscidosis TaxID=1945581 RepID=UPI0031E178DD
MDGAYTALKGYKFQFDKTILELFNNPKKVIEIEQLQDYAFDDYYIQVKHHDTIYSESKRKEKIKDPLLKLLDQFIRDKEKKFILYIYLKGVPASKKVFTIKDLDTILGSSSIKFSDIDRHEFIENFTLIYAEDFERQYNLVIENIKILYSKTKSEAEIYYSIISSFLLDIVIKNPPSKSYLRKTSKNEIDKLIRDNKKIIFNSSYADFKSRESQLKVFNNIFFKLGLNNEPRERIFIIQINSSYNITILKDIVLLIKDKWSKNNASSTPNKDRYAPYIYFDGILSDDLAKLKGDLQKDNYVIIDGYDFFNAKFNIQSVKVSPTYTNEVKFKFINNQPDLKAFLKKQDKTVEIYQFYFDKFNPINFNGKHIKIEINNLKEIKKII